MKNILIRLGIAIVSIFSVAQASAQDLTGTWQGTYNCRLGVQGGTFTFIDGSQPLMARHDFYPAPNGQAIQPGSFMVAVRRQGDVVSFEATEWIQQPRNYRLMNFEVRLNPALTRLSGRVLASGCGKASFDRLGLPTVVVAETQPKAGIVVTQSTKSRSDWRRIQKRLNDLGYNAGPVDGLPGGKTYAAISAFERANGLPVTGGLTIETEKTLLGQKPQQVPKTTRSASVKAPEEPRYTSADAIQKLDGDNFLPLTDADLNTPRMVGTWGQSGLHFKRKYPKGIDLSMPRKRRLRLSWDDAAGHLVGRKKKRFEGQLKVHRSRNGVDIVDVYGARFLIRFHDLNIDGASEVSQMDFYRFCTRPARKLVEAATPEMTILKRLRADESNLPIRFREQQVAMLATFGDNFKEALGFDFADLTSHQQVAIVERLRACAAYYPKTIDFYPVTVALFGSPLGHKDLLREGHFTKDRSDWYQADTSTTHRRAGEAVRKAVIAKDLLKKGLAEITSKGDARDQHRKLYSRHGAMLLPSEIEGPLNKLQSNSARRGDRLSAQAKVQAKAKSERTEPALSERDLLTKATDDYFLRNCNRAFLALKAADRGQGLLGVLTSRSLRAQNGFCTITTFTHIFSFAVRRVSSSSCDGLAPARCNFTVHWACNLELNPNFGFSSGTRNFDPVCPILERAPVAMSGKFLAKSKRKWIAQEIKW